MSRPKPGHEDSNTRGMQEELGPVGGVPSCVTQGPSTTSLSKPRVAPSNPVFNLPVPSESVVRPWPRPHSSTLGQLHSDAGLPFRASPGPATVPKPKGDDEGRRRGVLCHWRRRRWAGWQRRPWLSSHGPSIMAPHSSGAHGFGWLGRCPLSQQQQQQARPDGPLTMHSTALPPASPRHQRLGVPLHFSLDSSPSPS